MKTEETGRVREITASLRDLEQAVEEAFGVKWVDRFTAAVGKAVGRTEKLSAVTRRAARYAQAGYDELNQLAGYQAGSSGGLLKETAAELDQLELLAEKIAGLEGVLGDITAAGITALTAGLRALGAAADAVRPALETLWSRFFEPIARWTGGVAAIALNYLAKGLEAVGGWITANAPAISDFLSVAGGLATVFLSGAAAVGVFKGTLALLGAIVAGLSAPVGAVAGLILLISGIVTAAGSAGEMIVTLQSVLVGMGDFLLGVFTADWQGAWDGLAAIFTGVWNGMVIVAESAINLIISGINWLIERLNTVRFEIPSWVPGVGGLSYGISIQPVGPIKLPRLAAGAVIPPGAEFMAILGDQRAGRNLEAPESLLRQIVREEGGGPTTVRLAFTGSTAELGRALRPAIDAEARRQGTRLIVEG